MASLRNLAIGILRLRGYRNIAAALGSNARDAARVPPLLGITSRWPRQVRRAVATNSCDDGWSTSTDRL